MRLMLDWLAGINGFAEVELTPASVDASFRRYFRFSNGGTSYIVMDAPPQSENSGRFVRIAGYLEQMKLNCPRIIEADLRQGFLLLSDLGKQQYLHQLAVPSSSVDALYSDAIAALQKLQRNGRKFQSKLPAYDEDLLRFELSIFQEWLCERHLGIQFDTSEAVEWQRCCDLLVASALDQPRVFVHRDYHSRNLMLTPDNNPGILDFQDALEGPVTYDLISLLRDCYVSLPEEKVIAWARKFHSGLSREIQQTLSEQEFLQRFDLMGAQRHLKAAGIFARLLHRDSKPGYMRDVPRTLGYVIALLPRHSDLEFVTTLIESRCLPLLGEHAE
jgi:aminoglycoside/choline kinase family phosphotransferase